MQDQIVPSQPQPLLSIGQAISRETEQLIAIVIADRVRRVKMFTAFDISRVVQTMLEAAKFPFVRHLVLRPFVHHACEEYFASGLGKNPEEMGDGKGFADVYYHEGQDTSDYDPYDPTNLEAIQNPTHQAVPIAQLSGPVQAADTLIGRIGDDRGSLSIPIPLLKEIRLEKKGETAYIYTLNDDKGPAVVIVKEIPAGISAITSYTVDYHGQIRVTHATLVIAGVAEGNPNTDTYDLTGDNSAIYVRKHV